MDQAFWAEAWASGRTGFHKSEVNPVLIAHADKLLRTPQERVFVPLCGRTLDMLWLVQQGHQVVGAELVEEAVAGFFAQHGLDAEQVPHGACVRWQAGPLEVVQGDVFELGRNPLPQRATAIWDRAAMVALPPDRRQEYVDQVLRPVAAPGARILLNVFDYDPSEMSGPPFHVPEPDVRRYFADCRLELLSVVDGTKLIQRPDRPVSWLSVYTWLVELPV